MISRIVQILKTDALIEGTLSQVEEADIESETESEFETVENKTWEKT